MDISQIIDTLDKHSPDETSELGEAIASAIELLKKEMSRNEILYGAKLCPFCAGEATMRPEGDYWEITCDEPVRIFISGPMTGYENFNHEAFNRAEDFLREMGHRRIFNPACLDTKLSYRELLNICLKQLGKCDTIYMLRGWQKSHGAKVEHAYAVATGMTILYEGEEI